MDHCDIISKYEDVWQTVKPVIPSGLSSELLDEAVGSVKNGLVCFFQLGPLKRLRDLMTSRMTVHCSEAEAEEILDSCKVPEIQSNRSEVIDVITSGSPDNLNLLGLVNDTIKNCSNKALSTGLFEAFFGLTLEGVRLKELWAVINETKEFAITGYEEQRKSIQEKMDTMSEKLVSFAEGITPKFYENMDTNELQSFRSSKDRERRRLQRVMDDINEEIGELKVTVNGKIENLRGLCDGANKAALKQYAQGLGRLADHIMFASDASPGLVYANGVRALLHLVAGGSNLTSKQSAQDTILLLSSKLDDINQMKAELKKLRNKLEDIFDEFDENINPV